MQTLRVAKTQVNFRLDDWLKELLSDYCEEHGFKQERVVEALVFYAVGKRGTKDSLDARQIFELIQEVSVKNKSEKPNARKAG